MDIERCFSRENVDELCQIIDQQHQNMLDADCSVKKEEILRQLRGYITQYLYLVPHRSKFRLEQTGQVLAQSVEATDVFDPREAMSAFEDLAKYSINLLEQPWRKEFHKISLTSGFYMHNIKAHLQNPQDMLILLGYAGTDDYTLELPRVPGSDILKAFSRDCYVASHECLILSQVWERVQHDLPGYPLTVFEAWEARKVIIGDVDTVCSTLLVDARTRLYEQEMAQKKILQQKEHEDFQKVLEAAKLAPPPEVPVDSLIDISDDDSDCAPAKDFRKFKLYSNVGEDEIVKNVHKYTNTADKNPPPNAYAHSTSSQKDFTYKRQTTSNNRETEKAFANTLRLSQSSSVNSNANEHRFKEPRDIQKLPYSALGDGSKSAELEQVAMDYFTQQCEKKAIASDLVETTSNHQSSSSPFKNLTKKQDFPNNSSFKTKNEKKPNKGSKVHNNVSLSEANKSSKTNGVNMEKELSPDWPDTSKIETYASVTREYFPLDRTKIENPDRVDPNNVGVGKDKIKSSSDIDSKFNSGFNNAKYSSDTKPLKDKVIHNPSSSQNLELSVEEEIMIMGLDLVDCPTTVDSICPSASDTDDSWSCKFCTYLNPKAVKVCKMCSKTRDFNPD